jgi:G:T/U-mismatch repair DNA glycosylase
MLDELRAKLAALEETRRTAQRELEANRDAVLDYYEKMTPDALDSLMPEERRRFYTMLRLKVILSPDGSMELRGAAFPEDSVSVCGADKRRPSRTVPSWAAERTAISGYCKA